ncbi:nickel ABC transporter permease subunit NikC [Larsenimonas suaedae]|uniref:Nickel ABC transporter permease subunit NikC n=1 Tax=Larsenimonas suaedae TaxID=1851019 RepID=A0ABU1GT41_9GAMM|nr:nickel ABC transporter permease subunit NikC [Larsenimonas suaedae]MCM2972452.1 nickel ABC transporter permease subunit NikC [Larsenimonas suaedae]MDR5894752.1 nickel ABC transporter permease subunit NikC [Larsenimonas suaedae]
MPLWCRTVTTVIGLMLVVVLVGVALLAPVLSPYDPNAVDVVHRLSPMSAEHWLGTDGLGRDVLTRLMFGARLSLGTVAAILALVFAIGLLIGSLAGLAGGRVDQYLMRGADLFLTLPTFVTAMCLIGVLGPGMGSVIIAVAVTHWAWYARVVRVLVMSIRERDYVQASIMCGASRWAVFRHHMLPSISAQMLILLTLDLGHMMLHVAALSFLGLGVSPPTAEWGVMISDARELIWTQPGLIIWPGLAIFASVTAFNLLSDGVRDRLDPALKEMHG